MMTQTSKEILDSLIQKILTVQGYQGLAGGFSQDLSWILEDLYKLSESIEHGQA